MGVVASAQAVRNYDDTEVSIRMSNILRKYGPLVVGAVFLAAGTLNAGSAVSAADTNADSTVKQVRSAALPNVPGKSLTTVLVTYPNAPARPQILFLAAATIEERALPRH